MSLFKTGMLMQTAGISNACRNDPEFAEFVTRCFERHISGDWGDTCEDDAELNDESVKAEKEKRMTDDIMSTYGYRDGRKVWIKTEWDRSVTTVLFPEEY